MLREILEDYKQGWQGKDLWLHNSLMELKQRYRRSVLGPFWISLSLAIMIFSIGILWSKLWKIEVGEYLPYFTVGLLLWTFISTILTEGAQVFTKSTNIIKQINLPFSFYVYNMIWKNLLIFGHHCVVYILIVLFFKVPITASILLVIPGLVLYCLTALWVVPCLGVLCARFRDVEQIISPLLTVLFFMTPIIWKLDWSGKKALFIKINPIFHYIEILRAPLLGYVPKVENYAVVISCTIIGLLLSLIVMMKNKRKIAYWI